MAGFDLLTFKPTNVLFLLYGFPWVTSNCNCEKEVFHLKAQCDGRQCAHMEVGYHYNSQFACIERQPSPVAMALEHLELTHAICSI